MDSVNPQYGIYSVVYLLFSIFALYLSFRCNQGFDIIGFLGALFAPFIYIPWKLATCGVPVF